MIDTHSITTIVPVYNEVETIRDSIARIDAFLGQTFNEYEILIVESGSTDGSDRECDRLADRFASVRALHEGARNGFGSALRLGFASASKDLVWAVSADLPFPLEALLRAVPLLDRCDCVLSYRCEDDRGVFRRLQSRAYNTLARWVLRIGATNINSQFKLYRKQVIQSLRIESNGWLVDTEIVYRLQRAGVRTEEIGVPLIDRTAGTSTVGVATPFVSFWELMSFAWVERR